MSGFQAPDFSSSPPPSTPHKRSSNGKNSFSFGASNPSTTPAGPPPSSAGSFTPAGPPPQSLLGSSVFGNSSNPIKPLSFSQNTGYRKSQLDFNSSAFMQSPQANTRYQTSRHPHHEENYSEEEEDQELEDEYQDENQGYGYEDADGEVDEDMGDYQSELPTGARSNGLHQRSSSDLLLATPVAERESREHMMNSMSMSIGPKSSDNGDMAKDAARRMGIPEVDESPDVIIQTEALIEKLCSVVDNDYLLDEALTVIPGELTDLWTTYKGISDMHDSEEYTATIGPGDRASNFAKAHFIAVLALRINHPISAIAAGGPESPLKPLPQVLLEWIDEYHDPYVSQLEDVQLHRPNAANHPQFWETVRYGLLRGRVVAVITILKTAMWKHARAGLDDPRASGLAGQAGYTGIALANIEKAVTAAVQILSQCPAVHGDWNIRGSNWTLFRLRVSQAVEDLKTFAEGKNRKLKESTNFETSGRESFSRTARKAESQVPWSVYQNLLSLYGLVLGEANSIVENAQDWCEATVGLFVWWDEGKEDGGSGLSRSQNRLGSREPDARAYMRKLRMSFKLATADTTDFVVNGASPLELGLASVLEGDNEAVVELLRAWSGPISSAVAEVADIAGWLPRAEPQSLINMDILDQDDLDTLGMDSCPSKADGVKDRTLITYAESVKKRGQLSSGDITRDGWEIAIEVLGRLDTLTRSGEKIGEFLKNFALTSSASVNKLWRLLNDIGMGRHAENVAEEYAKLLAEETHKYGEVMWYYALSHKPRKVKEVLDFLISYSLMESVAYPLENELDEHLRALIVSPKETLTELSRMDMEAAQLLHKKLSGYGTLRHFYAIRDEAVLLPAGQRPKKGPVARREEAATALLAVITSSNDNIRGGLYDEGREAVVSVDYLLALLGEAIVFVNQPNFSFSVSQVDTMLKAIEDLQTVGPRIYSECNNFLLTVIASAQGLKGSSPSDMLKKSTSSMSGTSSFSLVGHSMIASQLKQSMFMGSSGVLVKGNIKRGWDWRHGITAVTKGGDILRTLRLGLAKDLAKAWMVEVDNQQ